MYKNKVILAPMVRVGTLPMRLTALDYGADLVYTDEIIDRKIVKCERVINEKLGTIDFIYTDNTLVLRTLEQEKNRLVFQMGTASPELALEAALKVKNDVAAIDVNCGCPKKFSTHCGMGSALLKKPDLLCEIMSTLVKNLDIPVTCKIRMLDSEEETISLVKRLEKTGVAAIALHCRKVYELPKDKGHWEIFKPVADAISIPLIANGDIFSWKEIDKMRDMGISSVMIARAAQWNPSVFRRKGVLPKSEACKKYLSYCIKYDIPYQNAKFVLCSMLEFEEQRQKLHKCTCLKDMIPIIYGDAEHNFEIDLLNLEKSDSSYDHMCPYEPIVEMYPQDDSSDMIHAGH